MISVLPGKILVPTDFSQPSERALQYALQLAFKLDARVHLLHAYTVPTLALPELDASLSLATLNELEVTLGRNLEQLVARFGTAGIPLENSLVLGEPRVAIVDAATALKADLIVMGTHGRQGLAHALIGSVAEVVVRRAPCPVLTVH